MNQFIQRTPPSPDATYCIWSFEHKAWWKTGGWGYTNHTDQAGKFTAAEAIDIMALQTQQQWHEFNPGTEEMLVPSHMAADDKWPANTVDPLHAPYP